MKSTILIQESMHGSIVSFILRHRSAAENTPINLLNYGNARIDAYFEEVGEVKFISEVNKILDLFE